MTDERDPNAGDPDADLTDDQLAAASADAEAEVDEQADDLAYDPEAGDAEGEAGYDAEDAAGIGGAPRRLTAREAADRSRERATGARAPRPPKAVRSQIPIDPALRIKDPASAWLVVGAVVLFALIFLRAMAFGHGGAFTATPTATPFVLPTAAPSVSPGPSGSGGASASPVASPAASPALSPAGT